MEARPPQLGCPEWYHAATLAERLALLRAEPGIESDPSQSHRRMQRWRSQSPFTADDPFGQRLATDGMTEDEFRRTLGIPVRAMHGSHALEPPWLAEIAESYGHLPARHAVPPLPGALRSPETSGFLNAVAPLIDQGCDRLREAIRSLGESRSDPPFRAATVEAPLVESLRGRLLWLLNRTMVLELNVARVKGTLAGTTPEERFETFVEGLRQPEIALALLLEYPVLARQVVSCIDDWVAYSLEFLQHLCVDWPAIQATFGVGHDLGTLVALKIGLGDRHRRGRSVLQATFSSDVQIVYKPRSLAIDAHFQELLAWVNERGSRPSFPTLRVLDRGTHGWVQHVSASTCEEPDEVRRFFERQGGYLALLYVLEATDFHQENLIAAGEHPVLLDLEALFHPRPPNGRGEGSPSSRLADEAMTSSVLRTGLLPQRVWSNADSEGIDISGFGGAAGQMSPDRFRRWQEAGTDTMRVTRERVRMPGAGNRPLLNGVEVDVLEHGEDILSGFTNTYELLQRHRRELLSDDGPLMRFADDEVRVIVRPSRIYARMLDESFHPDLLRDGLDRDRHWDRLWVGIEDSPHLVKAIRAERHDLHNADIPIFVTRPGSRDLWGSTRERIGDFFPESAMAGVRRRVEQLSGRDLERQRWFIMASLTSLSSAASPASRRMRRPGPGGAAEAESPLEVALAIGDRLGTLALRGGTGVSWVGLTPLEERSWSVAPIDADLYSGLPGLALFLAYLGSIGGRDRDTALARAAVSTLLDRIHEDVPPLDSLGAFGGWGGVIYALSHLGVLWNEPDLLAEAERVKGVLPGLVERDEAFDIIDGAAGCIGALSSLQSCVPSMETLAAATRCGERLVACAQPMESGIAWRTTRTTAPLAGFAHGSAGIAWALVKLFALTGEERFRTTAMSAVTYERSLFSRPAGNWPDLRRTGPDGGQAFMTAWCHGAPGIGLARLHSLEHLDDPDVRAEVAIALETTLAQGFGANHSLCHGDLGNVDLLLQASRTLNDSRWKSILDAQTAGILQSLRQHGPLCGVPLAVETPGLMAGLAGIGYGLLRLAEPTRVPSVLALEPPPLIVRTGQQATR